MSPRPGGETDKLGNRYELAWAIRHALYCLLDDRRALTLEDHDVELGQGSEFSYDTGRVIEVHQLKRQNGNRQGWTVKGLADMKVFDAAKRHVAKGRHYHFVSLIPSRLLQELSERARKSTDLAEFANCWLTRELSSCFDELSAPEILGCPQVAWDTIRGMWFSVHDEFDIIRMNSMLAESNLSGANGDLLSLAVGDILLQNLGKRLSRAELVALLAEHGIKPRVHGCQQTVHEQVMTVTNSWRQSIRRELLQPSIERAEVIQPLQTLTSGQIGLITGIAGGGKSSVLEQAVASLESTGAEVLALRLDRFDKFASAVDLGRQGGLETSPAVALAMAADGHPAYLVIDQLDAVSLASGRIPDCFDVVMDLIDEALSLRNMCVILACRQFDIDNDHRIRRFASQPYVIKVEVGQLTEEEIDAAVISMGLNPTHLTRSQRELLGTPLHLVLLETISSQSDALAFQSRESLFEAFWERKCQATRIRRQGVRFNDVVSRIVNTASDWQTLSVPVEVLDDGDLRVDADVLISEHVLAKENGRIAFFHEAFFDYAFARLWVSRDESLVNFLRGDEQGLFRRAQVRQILQHLYEREPNLFPLEVEAVLTADDIRFHIKETVLAVVANLVAPTHADAELMLRIAAPHPRFEACLWQKLRQPEWFARFYKDGQIAIWLDGSDEDMQNYAVDLMGCAVKKYPELVAVLLRDRESAPEYYDWLRWISRFSDAVRDRQMFDLLLEGVRHGAYDATGHELWLTVHDLAKHEPLWAIELLQARLIEHVDALALNEEGKVSVLGIQDYGANELVKDAADAEPLAFVQTIVPYLREIMAATAMEYCDDVPIRDQHFSYRYEVNYLEDDELGGVLLAAVVRSLETLAKTSPDAVQSLLNDLAADPYGASQFLLYRALTASGKHFADWAASFLLEGGRRLYCGYVSDVHWVARELLREIAPYVADTVHQQLENLFRDLRNRYENRYSWGHTAFKFLSALEESRLSPAGRRRLGEYRRKFEEEVPAEPYGIIAGVIGSPIPLAVAQKMTDVQWLSAMTKHNSDQRNWDVFTGGARELAQILCHQVAADPARFARLALQITSEYNTAYTNGVLIGFGKSEVCAGVGPLIFEAIRHIASLGQESNDRFLGSALQNYYREVPLDLVELILSRVLQAPNPANDSPLITQSSSEGQRAYDLLTNGINTARGSLAYALGDLLITDTDGQRSALVAPYLSVMAGDPMLSVRSCVAYTLTASLRYTRREVLDAFSTLVDTDDLLLAADPVMRLMIYIGNVNPEVIDPIIQRMLASEDTEAGEAGGMIAAFAALEWDRPHFMQQVLSGDLHIRKGAAKMLADRLVHTPNTMLATTSLISLMNDEADEVCKEANRVVGNIRGKHLRPYVQLLNALIESPSYRHAIPQLLLVLEDAPERVDDLVLKTAQRFIETFKDEASDIRTDAAADAHYISKLLVRGLAQCQEPTYREALLDVVDSLLEIGAYGIHDVIEKLERI